ncbi:hypothetical protein FW781_18660 [Chryseobacterium panacisoli]|uniref:Uncharacterized protein n=1 Tax=Chryseobacterium panacisoli TaxID=1807141 RepID=A0A5D8ZI01_9FLAO|nr:hypothetical protein [Chryseobacterium panacisoli]TZF93713.1 hypothetical protein FW781_18660 [Chryseobacterium panacisoli]
MEAINQNNGSQTLFRFATMRSAELSDPKNREKRFIFRNYLRQKGIIDPRVEAGESLKNVCEKITGLTIETEASLKAKSVQFYELSVWVAKNKVKATKEEFDAKIKTYKETPKPIVEIDSNIWDNLIYQVVTQKDFYAKETLMQFLHLDHILSNYDGATEAQYEDVIKAKVVLPKELFSAKSASSNTAVSRERSSIQSTPFNDSALKFAEATVNLKGNEELKRTLEQFEKNYQKEYGAAYETAYKEYQEQVRPEQARYDALVKEQEYQKEIFLAADNREGLSSLKYIPVPEVSNFQFNFHPEIQLEDLQRQLSQGNNESLQRIFGTSDLAGALNKVSTFTELFQTIEQNSQQLQQTILNNTNLNPQVSTTVGGVVIPVTQSVNTQEIPFFARTLSGNMGLGDHTMILTTDINAPKHIVSGSYTIKSYDDQLLAGGTLAYTFDAPNVTSLFNTPEKIPVAVIDTNEVLLLEGEVILNDGLAYTMKAKLLWTANRMYRFEGPGTFIVKNKGTGGDGGTGNCLPVLLRTRSFQNYSDRWLLSMTPKETTSLFSSASGTLKILDNNGNVVQTSNQLQVAGGGDYLSLFSDGILPQLQITDAIKNGCQLEAELTLDDGKVYTCKIPMTIYTAGGIDSVTKTYNLTGEGSVCLKSKDTSTTPEDDQPFIPSGFGMKNIGIADYRKVEQSTYCYVEGDVSHIENIMAREYREKSSRRLKRSESQTTKSTESEKEKLTDTTSTERNEMQSEISKVLQESKDFAAQAGFNASWGVGAKYMLNTAANYATHSSKEESNRQAVTEAKDVTARALERIVTKVKEERIDKILEEYEENNKHGFDNTKGSNHVVGVYRWVDKVVKNQIFNYGKRMMFEFMIPEPAKLHSLGMQVSNNPENQLVKPIDPRESAGMQIKDWSALTDSTKLKYWLGYYNVEVDEKLEPVVYVGKSIDYSSTESKQASSKSDLIAIPEHYITESYIVKSSNSFPGYNGWGNGASLLVGGDSSTNAFLKFVREVPITIATTNAHYFHATVNIKCVLQEEYKNGWMQKAFNKIIEAYKVELSKYEAALADAKAVGVQIKGSNPGFYRKIENTILRRNCISYMLNQSPDALLTFGKKRYYTNDNASVETFQNTDIKVDEKLDQYAAFIKFMEQAFEWEIMSYYFYPYYWGERKSWADLYQFDDNDPTFRAFMQSGMARVIVTVRPGFEEAVRHFLATGQIWNGGEVPVIDDPLFLSIVDELRSPKATKEGEPWREKIPTSLTILQAGSIGLIVEKALPCNCEPGVKFDDELGEVCGTNFEPNDYLLGVESLEGQKVISGDWK